MFVYELAMVKESMYIISGADRQMIDLWEQD